MTSDEAAAGQVVLDRARAIEANRLDEQAAAARSWRELVDAQRAEATKRGLSRLDRAQRDERDRRDREDER